MMPLSQQLLEGAETANAFETLISDASINYQARHNRLTLGKHIVQHTTLTDML